MRKKIVAGNWKMNTTLGEAVELARAVSEQTKDVEGVGVIVSPPFISLSEVKKNIDAHVGLAAQNCAGHESGAFTGEVSPAMVRSAGADYVIIGHSERRTLYGETDELLAEKTKLALGNGLNVIFCIGEQLEERESGKLYEVIDRQMKTGLFGFSAEEMKNIIIAYEPVWAIGTGKTATPQQAQEMHAYIRSLLDKQYGHETAQGTPLLYGGSCKPGNAAELFANPDVDGGLIGGASLKADDFAAIAKAF